MARPDSALTNEQFEVAEGLVVQPFAIQGQLSNPASIDVDDRGRVWVAEAFNYRKKTRKAGDRILILEDSSGNGRADKTTVFYQDPDIDGVHGVCVLGNKAIVSAPDRILLLTDTDGDDKADTKKLLFTGKVLNPVHGQHDHAIHAVMFGPDGRLYFNFGNLNAGLWHADGTLVRDVFGNPVNNSHKPYQEGMVIRCELDGTRVEVLGYNFRNNWEVTVDSFGTMWQSDNDNGSSSCRVNFVMEYGNYGYRDERTGADYRNKRTNMEATMQRRMWHQNDPGVVPNLLITGSGAPTGILVYEGDLLPEPFRGQMIHAEPGRNVVWAFPAKQAGAGYSARIVDIVRSAVGRNYRPSDVSVAPDGSLFIADWFDPVDCCHRTINDAGRIFRVAPPKHVYAVPAYDFKTPVGAVKALRSPNLSARYKAWTTLLGMQERARPTLEKMATDKNPRFRARALWALAAIKEGTPKAIGTALRDESENIRALALRIARRHQVPLEPLVRRLVHDESALVRRECAVSLHRLTSSETIQLWVELAAQYDGKDRWYLEALGIGEKGKETACLHAWLKKTGADWTTHANRDVVWRSRAPEAAMLLAKLLLNSDVPAAEHPRLLRALDFHSGKPKEAALAILLLSDSKRNPATYLEAFQRATPEFLKAHPKVMNQVESVLLASKGTVTFVDLVARFNRKDMVKHLMDMVQTAPKKEPGIRAAHQIFAFKEDHRIEAALGEPERTTAIIRALGFVGNNQAVAMLRTVTTDEARLEASRLLAITALGRSSSGAGALMQLVQQKKLPAKFMPPAIRSLASSPGPNTRSFAAQQQELLKPAGKRWPIELLLAAKPDASRGKAVFQKAGCIACHIVRGEGLDFGPELSDIGNKLSSEQLFEAILKPNQTISLGYEGVNVTLKAGTQLIGFVTSESKTTLSLRIPGGLRKDVLKANIKTRTAMKASLMPAGLEASISPQELVDLVGWLAPQNPAETPTAKNARVGGLLELLAEETANTSRPNVVVIFIDDLGWTDLGCYGSKFYETPHIDRLAKQGALFTRAYSSCNVCSPTRASLMTGKYPQRVGFTSWLNPRKPSGANSAATHIPVVETTIGEAFQQAGYRTGYIGKWHVGSEKIGMPKQHGFDWQMATAQHGLPGSYFHPYKRKGLPSADVPDLEDGKQGDYLTDALTEKGIGFIRETVKEGKKPFFLILGHYAVHTPIQAPTKLVEKYQEKKKRMYGATPLEMIPERFNRKVPARQQNPTYAGMVENLDTNVGKVIDALDGLGLTKDTIIVFTSDNGGSCMPGSPEKRPTSNYPLRASKGWNYEGGIRIPTFITWPGNIPAMKTSEPVITMDLYPTLLELTGCKQLPKQTVDGRSLVPLIRGERKTLNRPFLAWWYPHANGHGTQPCQAILKDGWKLVHYMKQNETELYRLDKDEGERNDLAKKEPKKARELLKTLNQWMKETGRNKR